MCSMDVPRDSGSLTCTSPIMSHAFGSCTCMFPIPYHMPFLLYCFGLTTRPCLRFSLMLTPFVSSTRLTTCYFWMHDSSLYLRLVSLLTDCLYLYPSISQFTIYTVGDGDLSLIFNLLCNHPTSVNREIPQTLSFPYSSLVKATALRF